MENEEQYRSQAMQDDFVCNCLDHKRGGTFVDLGAGHFGRGSNTYRLEKELEWFGIAAEKEESLAVDWLAKRERSQFFWDAFDPAISSAILQLSGSARTIDFLSLDLEPPELTLSCLVGLPLEHVRFAVICCEHDIYRRSFAIKNAMRGVLEGFGYVRVCEDVRMLGMTERDGKHEANLMPVEDWWVHPELVNIRKAAAIAAQIRIINEEMQMDAADRMNKEAAHE